MLFLLRMNNEVVRHASAACNPIGTCLKWSPLFCEKSSVRQRDRGTRLAVAGVLPGTAMDCRVPRVGRSPRRGRRSGIAPRLLFNAIVIVDGKLLIRESV
ncbi:trans-sialidase [Trypanosoma cruzi]|nr:trans-sialidase [Trypanosoma cruzi]